MNTGPLTPAATAKLLAAIAAAQAACLDLTEIVRQGQIIRVDALARGEVLASLVEAVVLLIEGSDDADNAHLATFLRAWQAEVEEEHPPAPAVAVKLTAQQRRALEAARDQGGAWYGSKGLGRAGGAYARMCERLAERGLVEAKPPYAITAEGLAALMRPCTSCGGPNTTDDAICPNCSIGRRRWKHAFPGSEP
jgi:hypothetical protein